MGSLLHLAVPELLDGRRRMVDRRVRRRARSPAVKGLDSLDVAAARIGRRESVIAPGSGDTGKAHVAPGPTLVALRLYALLRTDLLCPDATISGGAYGWTWGGTCYVRYLFVPASMRNQGHATGIIGAVEREALTRRCRQIVLETHHFQAPGFHRKLGFAVVGVVDGYPRGHRYLTMRKRLPKPCGT